MKNENALENNQGNRREQGETGNYKKKKKTDKYSNNDMRKDEIGKDFNNKIDKMDD